MTNILQRFVDGRDLTIMQAPTGGAKLGWPDNFPGSATGYQDHSVDMIAYHAILDTRTMNRYLKPNPLYITIMRDPWARAISAYNFFPTIGIELDRSHP